MSVIVPVRDRRELLRELLDALAAQTFLDFEVIVVDDGSTDGSAEEARVDAAHGRPVRVITTRGVGAVQARWAGIEAARADILAFTDSDCVPERGWMSAGVAAVADGADVVQGKTVPARRAGPWEHTVSVGDDNGLYPTCNVFYRRHALETAGGFDLEAGTRLGFRPGRARLLGFGEDALLGWSVRRRGRSVFEPRAIVRHHVFPPDRADAVSRAWQMGGFPALVREVPELRETLLAHGAFLGTSRLPLYGATIALACRQRAAATALTGWWVFRHGRALRRHGGTRYTLRALGPRLCLDGISAVALILGSIRARTVVL